MQNKPNFKGKKMPLRLTINGRREWKTPKISILAAEAI